MRLDTNWWLVGGAAVLLVLVLVVDWPTRRQRGGWWTLARHLLLVALLAGIGVRPVQGQAATNRATVQADVVIAIDRTASMGAVDVAGKTRAEAVAADVRQLVTSLEGARFSVVSFDNEARVELPSTTDAMAVTTTVNALGWREAEHGKGSDIAVAVPTLTTVLKTAQQNHPEAARLLYYFGDGEQTSATAPISFAPLAPLVDDATVVGYGSTEGAPMRRSRVDDRMIVVDGRTARSKADPAQLKRIAADLGGTFRVGPVGPQFAPDRQKVPEKLTDDAAARGGREWYWALAIAVQLLVLVDVVLAARRWKSSRQEMRA